VSTTKKDALSLYHRFRAEIGVSTAELQELFAQEVKGLTAEELLILKESDFYTPKTWTKEQEQVFIKMLARAAVKAKHKREVNHE
jgi:hypothetical protein